MASFLLFFVTAYFLYVRSSYDFPGTYFAPMVLAFSNIFVWLLLALATCSFISMLNKRFGEAEFSGPKCKLYVFLSVFSLSFFVRGTWDLIIHYEPTILGESEVEMAVAIFFVYFFTECLPIFVIYLNHLLAFHGIITR